MEYCKSEEECFIYYENDSQQQEIKLFYKVIFILLLFCPPIAFIYIFCVAIDQYKTPLKGDIHYCELIFWWIVSYSLSTTMEEVILKEF